MSVDADYLWEKLYPVAWRLARSADTIHQRIEAAFAGIDDMAGEDFSPESRLRYNDIVARMTSAGAVRAADGGVAVSAVANTLAKMPEEEASAIAEEMFALFVEAAELRFAGRRTAV